jgi:transposase
VLTTGTVAPMAAISRISRLTATSFFRGRGSEAPPPSVGATTLANGDEFRMNYWEVVIKPKASRSQPGVPWVSDRSFADFLPRRWVVERTFSWIDQNRRISKDYERLPESAEAFIYVAMSRLMARRLARS